MDLNGKTILVTGATGGIGKELVKELDKHGAKFILVSKSESELRKLIKDLQSDQNTYFVCDFSIQQEVVNLAHKIKSSLKTLDILINLAGIGVYKSIEEVDLDDWNNSLNIGLTSPFILIKELLGLLKKNNDSLVFNIGSGAGVIPMASRSAYCSMKFGLRGLTLSLAEEFKKAKSPSFCLITLGSTLTSFGPLSLEEKKKRQKAGMAYFTPDWVAKKLVDIIRDENREIEYTIYPGNYGFGQWKPPQ